jgi:TolB protein
MANVKAEADRGLSGLLGRGHDDRDTPDWFWAEESELALLVLVVRCFWSTRRVDGGESLRRLAVVGATLMLATGVLPQAQATVHGRNGRIAFRRYLNQAHTHGAIFTIKPHGTGLRRVTHPPRGVLTTEPDWSPNGRWIVYQVEPTFKLFKIRPNGSNRTPLSQTCTGKCLGDTFPAWSPSGRRIAEQRELCSFGSNVMDAIYVIDADGTSARRVTHRGATCATSHRYGDGAPAWAPSGNRLAFERVDHKREKGAIFTVRLDGSKLKRVTPWLDASQPDWSPNGRWIVFRSQKESETKGNILLVHPNGTGLHRITNGHGKFKWLSCSFSPNGKKIVAGRVPGSGQAGNADVYVMNLKGNKRRNLTKSGAWESAPDWGPR